MYVMTLLFILISYIIQVWDMQTGSLQLSCQHSSSEYILSCDVSQDDKRLLSASVDRYAKVNISPMLKKPSFSQQFTL